VCRYAPATWEWREYNNHQLGRKNMLCTLGQISPITQQALQELPVREVMDDLLHRLLTQA